MGIMYLSLCFLIQPCKIIAACKMVCLSDQTFVTILDNNDHWPNVTFQSRLLNSSFKKSMFYQAKIKVTEIKSGY